CFLGGPDRSREQRHPPHRGDEREQPEPQHAGHPQMEEPEGNHLQGAPPRFAPKEHHRRSEQLEGQHRVRPGAEQGRGVQQELSEAGRVAADGHRRGERLARAPPRRLQLGDGARPVDEEELEQVPRGGCRRHTRADRRPQRMPGPSPPRIERPAAAPGEENSPDEEDPEQVVLPVAKERVPSMKRHGEHRGQQGGPERSPAEKQRPCHRGLHREEAHLEARGAAQSVQRPGEVPAARRNQVPGQHPQVGVVGDEVHAPQAEVEEDQGGQTDAEGGEAPGVEGVPARGRRLGHRCSRLPRPAWGLANFARPLGTLSGPMRTWRTATLWVALLAAGVALAGAHSWGHYDDTRGQWLKGTVVSTTYQRPHQLIELEVQKPEHGIWTVVLASPSKMESRGFPVSRLVAGLELRTYLYPARDVPHEGRALRIVVDGNTTELW